MTTWTTAGRSLALLFGALVLAGCAGQNGGGAGSADAPPTPSGGEPSMSAPADDQVAQAVTDLAGRLSVTAAEIEVVAAEEVTWPDGALGCPQKDRMYTMALVDGRRIVLEAAGERYHYHAAQDRAPFLCENPQPPVAGGAGGS